MTAEDTERDALAENQKIDAIAVLSVLSWLALLATFAYAASN